jgi:lactose/L-arabinose transport system substrate-binding protein
MCILLYEEKEDLRMRKTLMAVAAAMLLTAMLAGCGAGGAGGGDVDEIVIWAWDPAFNIAALNIALEYFEAVHPDVAVDIVETGQDEITQQMNVAFAAGTMVGMPNIVLIENYRAQIFLRPFSDLFYPLDGYINPAEFTQYLIPPTSLDGVQFGVPFDTGSVGLFVRTDILEQAGFTPQDLWHLDWYELIDIAQIVLDRTGVHLATYDPTEINGFIRPNMMASGVWFTEPDGATINLNNSPILRRGVEVFQTLWDSGVIAIHTDWPGYISGFNTGVAWSVPGAVWITPSIMLAEEQHGNWAVVPYPRLPGVAGGGHAASWGGSSWYVLDLPGRELAAEFLALSFGGSVEFHERLIREVGALSVYLPFYAQSEALREGVDFFGGQPIFDYFTRWAAEIPMVNPGIHTYLVNDIIDVAWVDIHGGRNIQEALDAAQHHADTQLMN